MCDVHGEVVRGGLHNYETHDGTKIIIEVVCYTKWVGAVGIIRSPLFFDFLCSLLSEMRKLDCAFYHSSEVQIELLEQMPLANRPRNVSKLGLIDSMCHHFPYL